ncbi:MAG TPA: lysine--tRNA ligase [Candidatus Magasanikbacteria bacterium]|nr:MAG: lysine--tRNA ligase [Candidatus Magasanikbacteria bacterium RIFCSPLOWO2_02_FULL_47_16]OGH80007.1 MAG: lysine--tRNA ligase [Candidatus Magasanikbacteria bacterium RIFCSPHIGHO2_02_FULL_48_18]HAZ28516.1 lysine--tRNA ligase [Candidatus Magasanikbacteria bacterium]
MGDFLNINDERNVRLQKLEDLKKAGVNPFPARVPRMQSIHQALAAEEGETMTIAGRIMSKREMGKLTFCHVQDESGKIQVVCKQDDLGKDEYAFFLKKIDIGDIVSFHGTRFQTHKGEPSILIQSWTLATKSLLPLPDKFHGLQDEETRLRKRYLDLLFNPEMKQLFRLKAAFWKSIRDFLIREGFFEVETPYLETTTGGAEARPFQTHHHDFDMNVYLRISVGELWQKRLLAAGYEKTFEIGRIFRNEGSSPEHLQEFTNVEFYWAYADYKDGMKLTERLIQTIAEEVFGTTTFHTKGFDYDVAGDWPRIDYREEVLKQTGIDILTASEQEMTQKLEELGVDFEGKNKERLMDSLWKYCRKHIAGPIFLVHHPKLVSPLSKAMPENPDLTERFQVIIAGAEVVNGFSELNDPVDQRQRFELQQQLIEKGDAEAMMPDWEFVEMLEHGMPPACGFGMGERLFAFFVDKPIRECQLFPLMKPISGEEKEED